MKSILCVYYSYNILIVNCMSKKTCLVCGTAIEGRRDKIYCSASCKSASQYERRLKDEERFYQVDRQLKINRKILKRHNLSGKTMLRKAVLLAEGFNPHYFTHFYKTSKGDVYFFCYEYGFTPTRDNQKDKYLLVSWQPHMEKPVR